MRTCCGRMLKFIIRYVRNKLAVSSDVGFAGDRRRCTVCAKKVTASWYLSFLPLLDA